MKKTIFISFLLLILLIAPADADLFNEMSQKVLIYNQNVDKVPGVIERLLGNEEINGIIGLNDGSDLSIKLVTKDAKVIEFTKVGTKIATGKGDCNNNGEVNSVDALCALRMSVGKMEEDNDVDVDENQKVNSLDARIILQAAVGLSSEVNPTLVIRTNENTMHSIMDSKKPVDVFLDALDSGAIDIKAESIFKGIFLSLGNVLLKVARSVGLL